MSTNPIAPLHEMLFPNESKRWRKSLWISLRRRQCGISLIELIMFIVIVSVALAGILGVMNVVTRGSADPLVHKQALAIAESMLEEVELMPFTFCDQDDANVSTAQAKVVGAGGCATWVEGIGVENDISRYDAANPYDNVSDYDGFDSAADGGVKDITGTVIRDIQGNPIPYRVVIGVSLNGVPAAGGLPAIAGGDALHVVVTVTGPDSVPITIDGMRTLYAPRL